MSENRIRFIAGEITLEAELYETETAGQIFDMLPVQGQASVWGEEIYFEIPVYLDIAEDARETVDMGDLGYWPSGHAFCIFFGPTPISNGNEIRPASAVNVFGQITGDATVFTHVSSGADIKIEKNGT
jgi:hypothetical protein